MKRVGIICLALVLALGSLGVGYAAWTETLYVEGTVATGELDWVLTEFTIHDPYAPPLPIPDYHSRDGFALPTPRFWADPDGKNVGWGNGTLVDGPDGDGDMSQLNLTLHNVYPSYFNEVAVYAMNTGTIPLKIDRVIISSAYETYVLNDPPPPHYPVVKLDLTGDGTDDIEIWWKDSLGVQMHPGEDSPEMGFWIHVLPAAPQGATLTFTLEIVAVQWNKYPLP